MGGSYAPRASIMRVVRYVLTAAALTAAAALGAHARAIYGTSEPDTIRGTRAADLVYAGAGFG